MSFTIKKISMDLSPESIDHAIAEVNLIRNSLHPAMMHLISKLAEKGVEIARAELIFFDDPAYYTGTLSESVMFKMHEDGATISAGEGAISGYGDTSYAVMVEYGTGVYGADINGHGWEGWTYLNPNDGKWHHTVGMPARPFMHNTLVDLEEEARSVGGRIVAEYLADEGMLEVWR